MINDNGLSTLRHTAHSVVMDTVKTLNPSVPSGLFHCRQARAQVAVLRGDLLRRGRRDERNRLTLEKPCSFPGFVWPRRDGWTLPIDHCLLTIVHCLSFIV